MARGRSTLILFVVLVALGAYIWFVERKREPASEAETKREKVFTVEADKIHEVQVVSSTGETTTLKKDGSDWKITAPSASDADEGEVSGLTSNLATLETQRVVSESPKDLAAFGLDSPRVQVAFKAAGDKDFKRLLLGSKTPTGGDLYAKVGGGNRVFLISGFLDSTFDRKTFDLRDKAVLKVDRDKVDTIEISSKSSTTKFARVNDGWRITGPIQASADSGAVEGLLGRVANGQMRSIADPAPADLAAFGLDAPEYTVTLGAGSARSVFLVSSKQSPDGQPYAKDASRPLVFTVDSFMIEDLKKPVSDFRPKDLFEFRTFNGTRLEFTRDGATMVFEKKKGKDASAPEKWARTQPAKTIDETKIVDFLSKLTNLRAESFVDALPGGAVQASQAKARHSDGKKEDLVTLFKAGDDVYATRAGDPGAAKLQPSEYAEVLKTLDAVK